jgi:maleate isomerase
LINPPWFSVELSRQGANYFHDQGLDVVHHGPAGLPSDQLAIDPAQVHEWVCAHTPANAEAVFIAGNGFRSIGAIQVLEKDLSRPVLTANQVAFWLALRLSGARIPIAGYGRIFDRELSSVQTR